MRIRKGRNAKVLSWIMMVMFVLYAGTAWALPSVGFPDSGSSITNDGKTMTINQTKENQLSTGIATISQEVKLSRIKVRMSIGYL